MDIPTDWMKVDVNDRFTFWIPPGLVAVDVRGIDSYIKRWESKDIIVHFDYGRFSDPLTSYSRKKSYETTTEQISGYTASIVSFELDNDWWFTAIHFPDLGSDTFDQTIKLTLVVESSREVGNEVPLRIVKSVKF